MHEFGVDHGKLRVSTPVLQVFMEPLFISHWSNFIIDNQCLFHRIYLTESNLNSKWELITFNCNQKLSHAATSDSWGWLFPYQSSQYNSNYPSVLIRAKEVVTAYLCDIGRDCITQWLKHLGSEASLPEFESCLQWLHIHRPVTSLLYLSIHFYKMEVMRVPSSPLLEGLKGGNICYSIRHIKALYKC